MGKGGRRGPGSNYGTPNTSPTGSLNSLASSTGIAKDPKKKISFQQVGKGLGIATIATYGATEAAQVKTLFIIMNSTGCPKKIVHLSMDKMRRICLLLDPPKLKGKKTAP